MASLILRRSLACASLLLLLTLGASAQVSFEWKSVPGTTAGDVTCMAVFDGGSGPQLIVAGTFLTIGGTAAQRIARWDGSAWLPLGAGISGPVYSLATFNDGTGTALYASGFFNNAGGIACANVAKWNGTSWTPLGSGIVAASSPGVDTLLALEGPLAGSIPYLVAGGSFQTAGGITALGVAAWNGSFWGPVGNVNFAANFGTPRALAVFDDGAGPKLYAAGHGGAIGAVPANGLQRFDGFSWSAVPGWVAPPQEVVNALAVFDDGQGPALYFGADNAPTLVKLTGSGFVQVANATAGGASVSALRVFDEGDGPALYIGGLFSGLGGIPASGVARLRGGMITQLAQGVTPSTVHSLGVYDDGSGPALFVGGQFTQAGGVASSGIARWGAGAPVLGLSQTGGAGTPAMLHCSNLQAGREYLNIASVEICAGAPGSGPWLGLCASDPTVLYDQAALQIGTDPFHFLASGTQRDFGPYGVPSGLAVQAITLDFTGSHVWRVSPVASFVFQ